MVRRLVPLLFLLAACSFLPLRAAEDELAAAPAPLAEALHKLQQDNDRWASTRTSRYFDEDGKLEKTDIERYDPSLPPDEQWTFVSRDGRPPTAGELRSWRRQREREMRRRDRSLGAIMDFAKATLAEETRDHLVYQVPVKPGVSRRIPTDKFYILAQVSKARGELDRLAVRPTGTFRVAGVAKVNNAEMDARFAVIDPAYVAQPTEFMAGGTAKVAFFLTVGGRIESRWSDFERVEPYSSRFDVKVGELQVLEF